MREVQVARYVKSILLVGIITLSGVSLLLVRGKAHANGGYPWSGAVCVTTGQTTGKCPNYEWSLNGQTRNPSTGNYYYRNCTDYAAWKLMSAGVSLGKVSGLGSAGSWDDNAPSRGLSVSGSPAAGSIGVDERYGHVVFVESINGGTITISEYNWGSTGSYGTRSGTPSQLGLTKFVNFGLGNGVQPSQPSYETYWSGTGVKSAQYLGINQLYPGQIVRANQYIESSNTRHVLLMQPDGNLVQYGDGFRALWYTGTQGNPGAYAAFQGDGNLVVYASNGRALWNSGVRPGANRFALQDDGHLVTYNAANNALWWSGVIVPNQLMYVRSDNLRPGQTLWHNQFIRSNDGRYSMLMQADGNLVLYGPGHHALWHTYTYGQPGARLEVQTDGNLVVYSRTNVPLWAARPRANPSHFVVQSDGNLVQYNTNGSPLWASNTPGRL